MILCIALHLSWKFCTNRAWFGVVMYRKPPKSSPKCPFFHVRETLKIHNLTTTNAMKMKLGTIVYLIETFYLTKDLGRFPNKKTGCGKTTSENKPQNELCRPILTISLKLNKNCHIYHALLCTVSVVKISNKFDQISWGYMQ